MQTGQKSTSDKGNKNQDQIISYLTLRLLIGLTGILIPLLVVIGKWISERTWQLEFSISDYYDNGAAGDMLVGILFVLGFFLMAYKGPLPIDNITAKIGCITSLGASLFPTTFCSDCWVHALHFVFAFLLFSVFIFFSIYLFRKTHSKKTMTVQKKYRNRIYLVCGIIMILCIVAIAISFFLLESSVTEKYKLVFWFESIALVSFGISWITKSESFYLKDKNLQ